MLFGLDRLIPEVNSRFSEAIEMKNIYPTIRVIPFLFQYSNHYVGCIPCTMVQQIHAIFYAASCMKMASSKHTLVQYIQFHF